MTYGGWVDVRKAAEQVSEYNIIICNGTIWIILTRHDIARIHSILVLDKAEAIHKLNFGDLAGAMGVEVVLNIGLGSYNHKVQSAMPCQDSTKILRVQLLDPTKCRDIPASPKK